MSAYDNDSRVTAESDEDFTVSMPGLGFGDDEVIGGVDKLGAGGRWRSWVMAATVASRDLLGDRGWREQMHSTADEAIRSLIGEPQ